MHLLVLGGTAFVGRHLVEAALARDHEVTLFTRGQTNPALFPELEHLTGDRGSDLSQLAGRSFDAVLDTSGYVPRVVRASAELLAPRAGLYVFVSSLSVYDDASRLDESSPTQVASDPESEDVTAAYGPLKVLCEQAVEAAMPGRALVLRPGLVVGRYDYTGRFGYWPRRVAEGGKVLAPGRLETRVWLVDGRDLAEWTIRMVEAQATGVFNVAGPGEPLTMGALLDECKRITGSDAELTWVDDAFLLGHGVLPYTELPLWVPELDGGYPFVDAARAVAAGLTFRPVAETIRDVLAWDAGYDADTANSFGLSRTPAGMLPARERTLLAEWHDERAPAWTNELVRPLTTFDPKQRQTSRPH
jgi:nucleoside-diphosphate-sugar epimerase